MVNLLRKEGDRGDYCHDREIHQRAAALGIKDKSIINTACSIGEQPYGGLDNAFAYLEQYAEQQRSRGLPRSERTETKQRRKDLKTWFKSLFT